jgi:D-alanine-D-alanine ligase-like ATP-grasp enzyme
MQKGEIEVKKDNKKKRGLSYLLQKLALKLGATVLIEPKWGIVGQITYRNGRRSYFRHSTLDLNPVGASEISKDKDYANFFMKEMGYPIVPGSQAFLSDSFAEELNVPDQGLDAAFRHAQKLGFPVIIKPNDGSQGVGVSLVHNKKEFYRAMGLLFKSNRIVLVQRPVKGKDYRVVVLDEEVISVYERIPLNVVGDGKASVAQLLGRKQKQFARKKRDTKIKADDPRIANKLRHQDMTLESVPGRGQTVYLLDNANLSAGGDSVDVTDQIHPKYKGLAVRLTSDMGLRLCGVDLMVEDDISQEPGTYWILEINAAPGLDHYAKIGEEQQKTVEALYLKVLQHMER